MKETETSIVEQVQGLIENLCNDSDAQLEKGYEEISLHYRSSSTSSSSLKFSPSHIWAYALARMPATCGVATSILKRLIEIQPDFSPDSLLDLGSGPGSMIWSSLDEFSSLKKIAYWEAHPLFKNLVTSVREAFFAQSKLDFEEIGVTLEDSSQWTQFHAAKTQFDMVWASYVLGELSDSDQRLLLDRALMVTRGILVLSEPGTPEGFKNIRQARSLLLESGAHILAPCTHAQGCPMETSSGDWCHFPALLERRDIHRRIKNKASSLPWEVEKYAYLIVSPRELAPYVIETTRIIKNPLRRKGHRILDICSSSGEERVVVSKKNGGLYKKSLKKNWGDIWEIE